LVPSDPGRSLLLTKPPPAFPTKAGRRFEIDSPDYQILSGWMPPAHRRRARMTRGFGVSKSHRQHATLQPGASQQLTVRAHFSDGKIRDVTRWAKFTDANASVTQVDDTGGVKVMGFGERRDHRMVS